MEQKFFQIGNRNMEYIVAIEQYQSISQAAESLFITQPALSRFLHHLEHRLGVRLFNRLGNRFIPTYEGERYLYYAKKIMALELQMQNEFADIDASNRGRLRLALPTLRSSYVLPFIVPHYRRLYPHVDIVVKEVHSQGLEKLLVEGEVDFAILNLATKHPDIVSTLIRHDEVLLALPRRHPLAAQGKTVAGRPYPQIDIRLFKEEEFILQHEDQRTRQAADRVFSEAGIKPPVLLVTRSIEAALKLVCMGTGVCFVAETYAHQIALPQPLSLFSIGSPHTLLDLSLAYMKNSHQPTYFRDFIEIVRKNL